MRTCTVAALAALLVLAAAPAIAGSVAPDFQTAFAGEWRGSPASDHGACGPDASDGDFRFTVEFAVTGGQLYFDDGSEDAGAVAITSASYKDGKIVFSLGGGDSWALADLGDATMQTVSPPKRWPLAKDVVFRRCRPPVDRSAIALDKKAIAAISSAMPPDNPIFIDARAKGGCKAVDYQYLTIDLVGPEGFALGRWNSTALAEKLADGKKVLLATDEVSNWTIDAAEAAAGGARFTITELIPPNGSRGDTTKITLVLAPDGTASVPEWHRSYLRCASAVLAAE